MMLPDYWMKRPGENPDDSTRDDFNELFHTTLDSGDCPTIEYSLHAPIWQFLCHLSDYHDIALHGSGNLDIPLFEPRKSNDINDFGNQKAVYAASDGILAMFFAIVDRGRVSSITNACIHLEEDTGAVHGPFYVFSVSQSALANRPWRSGAVYLLPRQGFLPEPPMDFGSSKVHIAQLASFVSVKPLAKIIVTPGDFPFLAQIRGHDDQRLHEYASALQTGSPWPND